MTPTIHANDDFDPIPAPRHLAPAAAAFVGVMLLASGFIFAIGFLLGWCGARGLL